MNDDERVAATLKLFEDSLKESESLGEEVLMEKQQLVDLDRKRNSNREALAELKKMNNKVEIIGDKDEKLWFCLGSFFVKLPKNVATDMIKQDQTTLNESIDSVQKVMKEKVQRIQDIGFEADPKRKGNEVEASHFNLKPLTRHDVM